MILRFLFVSHTWMIRLSKHFACFNIAGTDNCHLKSQTKRYQCFCKCFCMTSFLILWDLPTRFLKLLKCVVSLVKTPLEWIIIITLTKPPHFQPDFSSSFGPDNQVVKISESEVTQSCPTLCDPMDCSPTSPPSMEFSRQEYWSGLPFPSPGDLPDPGTEPGSPAL